MCLRKNTDFYPDIPISVQMQTATETDWWEKTSLLTSQLSADEEMIFTSSFFAMVSGHPTADLLLKSDFIFPFHIYIQLQAFNFDEGL